MSARSPKPDSSVAGDRLDVELGPAQRARRAQRPGSGRRPRRCPGRSRRPARIAPVAQPVARPSAGSVSVAERAPRARRRARRSCRAASCGTTPGASVISLSRKCGDVAAVDVAGRDLRRAARRRRVTGSVGAVVGRAGRCLSSVPAASARRARRPGPRLAAGRLERRLAVEAQVRGRLLDHAVRLAGDDERVLGRARRTAPGRCPAARAAAGRARSATLARDGDRALERGDRRAERLDRVEARGQAARRRASGSPWRRW